MQFENYTGSEPMLYCVYEDDTASGESFGPYVNYNYLVECNIEGFGAFFINGKEYPVRPGDCYVILPGRRCTHTTDSEKPRRGVYCRFVGLRAGEILNAAGINDSNPYAPPEAFAEILSAMEKMLRLRRDGDAGAELRRTACIYELLGAFMRTRPIKDPDTLVRRSVGIFESEYHRPLSVEEVAAEVGFERSYFSTAFKERTGVTPHAYLISVRIRHAAELLAEDGYSVSEVAASVGLSPVNFSRIFSRVTGMTPLEYKKRAKKAGLDFEKKSFFEYAVQSGEAIAEDKI